MECADKVLGDFQPFWEGCIDGTSSDSEDPQFPEFSLDLIHDLITCSIATLSASKAIIDIPSPIVFVGDLHGNLQDLLRVLQTFGVPPTTRYLFLGDYVDRGQYSIAVISIILSFLCKYPDRVFVLRGNHEFSHINRAYGFYDEIMNEYGSEDLWNRFQEVFSWMPLAAVVQGSVFCVHGGLSPLLTDLQTLRDLPMPIPNYLSNTMISDLVWSDPADTAKGFQLNHRGSGQLFGPDAVESFLRNNRLKIMIRAHQCTISGFRAFANFMGITVFSSSNYCKAINNKCGVVVLKEEREMSFFSLEPDSDMGLMPRAIMSLPMDGDIGLKRMFRAISRPEIRSSTVAAGQMSDDSEEQPNLAFRRSLSVSEDLAGAT